VSGGVNGTVLAALSLRLRTLPTHHACRDTRLAAANGPTWYDTLNERGNFFHLQTFVPYASMKRRFLTLLNIQERATAGASAFMSL